MALLKHLSRRVIIVSIALFCSALGANIVALICFLLIRPFSRALYRRLVAQYVACMWIDSMSLLLPGANIHITGDSDMPDGKSYTSEVTSSVPWMGCFSPTATCTLIGSQPVADGFCQVSRARLLAALMCLQG